MFKNFDTVQLRLLQAGVRIAGVINDIYTRINERKEMALGNT